MNETGTIQVTLQHDPTDVRIELIHNEDRMAIIMTMQQTQELVEQLQVCVSRGEKMPSKNSELVN